MNPHGTGPERAPRRAIALRHDRRSDAAPSVVAKGGGEVAERILACAREHGVAVREDRDLVELLSACEVGEEVPIELYEAVARLLSLLYVLNEERVRAGDPPLPARG